jgi:O-antigen/teichoic acid export membrane protein
MNISIETEHPEANIRSWARGGAIGLGGNVIGFILMFLWQFSIARMLGSAGVGVFSLADSVISMFSLFALFGLNGGALRFIPYYQAKGDKASLAGMIRLITTLAVAISILVGPLLVWKAGWISERLFGKPELTETLRMYATGFPFFVMINLLTNILQGFKQIGEQVLVQQVLEPILQLGGILLFFYLLKIGTVEAAIVMVVSAMVLVLVLWRLVRRQYNLNGLREVKSRFHFLELFKYSTQIFLMILITQLSANLETFFMGIFAPSEQVGIYSVSVKAAAALLIFSTSLNLIGSPTISSLYANNDFTGIHSLYKTITRWAYMLSIPFFLMLMILSAPVMGIFGNEFKIGGLVLQLIAIGQEVNIITGPCGWILNMTGRAKSNLYANIVYLIIVATLSSILIPKLGARGAGVTLLIAITVVNLIRLIQVYRIFHIHPYDKHYLQPTLAGVIVGIVFLFATPKIVQWNELAGMAIIGVAILFSYAILLLCFGFSREDTYILNNLINSTLSFLKNKKSESK